MRLVLPALLAATLALGMPIGSADAATAQQQRMTDCNAAASEGKFSGDARKEFMTVCLKGDAASEAAAKDLTPQQKRMASCNGEAAEKGLTGDKRKSFMSSCLKGAAPIASAEQACAAQADGKSWRVPPAPHS